MLKEIRKSFMKQSAHKKIQIVSAAFLSIVFLTLLPTYAWFTYKRSLITATKVQKPTTIELRGAHDQSIKLLDLSGIDVIKGNNEDKRYYDYVIGVDHGEKIEKYALQLSYTTNIPFTYTLYRAEEQAKTTAEAGSGKIIAYDKNAVDYQYYCENMTTKKVDGKYKNTVDENSNGDAINDSSAERSFYKRCYDEYTNVQKDAIPVYWISYPIEANLENGNDIDYFILRISWKAEDELTNDGETDIIYISAAAV